jgi:hypothetical protein
MKNEMKEQWLQLCEQAALEQDSERLLKLIKEISRMLDEKNGRLQQYSRPKHPHAKTHGRPGSC